MIHVHRLRGCSPTPLAHYLKSLGILRLVAEQRDPSARGWWKDECFHLATTLDAGAMVDFFANEYSPSPITAPWNKGAGFFVESDPGLGPIERSRASRFEALRTGIAEARTLIDEIVEADAQVREIKAEVKRRDLSKAARDKLRGDPAYKRRLAAAERVFADRKARLIPSCGLRWRGLQRRWMDAAIVLPDGGKPVFPALLGTGGNDGRLDFTNNYYQRLVELFDPETGQPRPNAIERIQAALWGDPGPVLLRGVATGQYLPGSAGGANSGSGPTGESSVNPIDFVLALEGTLFFAASVTRRLDIQAGVQAAAPFAVRSAGTGYASASAADEGPRGEQWMPLWEQPMVVSELLHLFAEGRSRMGRSPVREPLEFARAVARLGVARGIRAFERFGYIERNGQSNLAVPLGRFVVPEGHAGSIALLDGLDPWLSRLRREARDERASARLRAVERQLSDSLFAVVAHPDEPARWQSVLGALADVEAVLASGMGFRAGPIPALDPGWARAADDGTCELRLAVAFALQGTEVGPPGKKRWDGVRRHWLPLDEKGLRFATTGDGSSPRLATKSEVVIGGRSGVADAIALVERRLIEGALDGNRHLPLRPARGAIALLDDVTRVVAGEVDLDRTLRLARAFMAIDRQRWAVSGARIERGSGRDVPDDAWTVIRLACLPWPLEPDRAIGADPAIVRRLDSGDGVGAFEVARRRLAAAGFRTPIRRAFVDPSHARLWAAALAFPISHAAARALAARIDPASTSKGVHR